MRLNFRRSLGAALASTLIAGGILGVSVSPVSAHAIIDLEGQDAVAGTTSEMKLEIQHGCVGDEPGVIEVQAFVGKRWRKVAPLAVSGWTSEVERQPKGGLHITWKNQGAPTAFGTPVFFPIEVSWPKKPGTYGMTVFQQCPQSSTLWNTKFTAATANAPSPPLTPLPEVQVKKSS
jgi:uncharacterized protein YcnI